MCTLADSRAWEKREVDSSGGRAQSGRKANLLAEMRFVAKKSLGKETDWKKNRLAKGVAKNNVHSHSGCVELAAALECALRHGTKLPHNKLNSLFVCLGAAWRAAVNLPQPRCGSQAAAACVWVAAGWAAPDSAWVERAWGV